MLDLKSRGVKFDDIVAMRYVDFGLDLYANGIVVSAEMLKNEKAVKGFIAATLKGWKDVVADNEVGIAAAKKKDPLIDEALSKGWPLKRIDAIFAHERVINGQSAEQRRASTRRSAMV